MLPDWLALVISIIALVATAINIYLQYYKIELFPYSEVRYNQLFLIIENTSNNFAKNYTVKFTSITAPGELIVSLREMPLVNGEVKFNLAPRKKLEIFLDLDTASYMEELQKFPVITVEVFNEKQKTKGKFDVDFSILKGHRYMTNDAEKLRKEISKGLKKISKEIKDTTTPQTQPVHFPRIKENEIEPNTKSPKKKRPIFKIRKRKKYLKKH